jgi:tetratricopeptide (TPR) repeat protein
MDLTKLAYLGESYGGLSGPLFLAIDDRFKAAVFLVGGLPPWEYAREIDPLHFAPRVTTPTLMVNGRDDEIFSLVTSQIPLFRYLGTPPSDKEHHVVDGSHTVDHQILASETLRWFDRYLGPVDSQAELPELKPEERRARLLSRAEALLHAARYVDAIALCDEILADQRPDPDTDDPTILRVMRVKAEALKENGQPEDALSLYDALLPIQRRVLGAQHPDTQATTQRLADLCTNMAWGSDFPTIKTAAEYDRAFELIQAALKLVAELDPPAAQRNQWACLAYIQCRRGDGQAALQAMDKSLIHDTPYPPSQWLYMAMIHSQLGHQDLARDWFAAACEWMIKKNVIWSGFLQLRDEVAAAVGLAGQPLPVDFDGPEWIDRYTRLIAAQPELAQLYHCRGSHFGRRKQWPEAADDYLKAAELQPTTWDYAQAYAAVVFHTQPIQDHTALCRRLFDAFHDHKDPGVRMNLVTHCSVVLQADLDREALNRLADGVFAESSHNSYTDLGKGMALYRLGRFEEALDILPDETQSFGSEKDELLARLFRAMTHRQLGDAYTSRRLLNRARDAIRAKLAGPDGPLCRYEDRPVVWCMVQTVLREADTLIEPNVMTRGRGE